MVAFEVVPRRIEHGQDVEERPGLPVILRASDREGAKASRGKIVNRAFDPVGNFCWRLSQIDDRLRRALGDSQRFSRSIDDRRLGALRYGIEGDELLWPEPFQRILVLQCFDHRGIDRVAILNPRGERGGKDAILRVLSL